MCGFFKKSVKGDINKCLMKIMERKVLDETDYSNFQNHIERRRYLIKRIEDIVYDLIWKIVHKEKPSLTYNDGKNSGWTAINVTPNDESNSVSDIRMKTLRFTGNQSRQRFALIMTVMSYVHSNLLKNLNHTEDDFYCTKRSFYYSLKNECIKRFVTNQQKVEWAINQVTLLLECAPWELGFISTSKGLVAGDLNVHFGDAKVMNYEKCSYHAVPDIISNVTRIQTSAEYVLVVEKDSVFQKLLREDCPSFNNCILVTGKGYPDIPTRMFVHMLSEKAHLPIYALVDANPHGFEIMCVYRFGTLNNLGYRKKLLCPEMRWLGIHQSDLNTLDVVKVKLTKKDMKKIEDIKNRSYIDIDFSKHLMEMKLGKAEIESVSKPVKHFLTEYLIPTKIRNKEYF